MKHIFTSTSSPLTRGSEALLARVANEVTADIIAGRIAKGQDLTHYINAPFAVRNIEDPASVRAPVSEPAANVAPVKKLGNASGADIQREALIVTSMTHFPVPIGYTELGHRDDESVVRDIMPHFAI